MNKTKNKKIINICIEAIKFQENLLKTLLQIEDSINEAAKFYHNEKNQNCIIIYDRGAMDPVACN